MNSVERIRYYAQMPTEDWKGTASLPAPTPRGSWPDQGGLLLKNLTLAYRPHLPPALHGLSCQIKPGQKVGICGRTGAGKSTLLLVSFFWHFPNPIFMFTYHKRELRQLYVNP
jgi:ABC-type multidrug transport system fused ATPase/permease subunit